MTIDHLSIPARDQALSPPPSAARYPKAYLAGWSVLALISACYLTLGAIHGIEGPSSASAPQQIAQATQTEQELAKRADENQALRRSLADLQADIGHLKSDLNNRGVAPLSLIHI